MSQYNTEQKKALIAILKKNSDAAYSIEELIIKLRQSTDRPTPGKSTVYRLMTRLVDDGTVKRFVKGNTRTFAYQIIKNESCHHHLHLKCTTCGKLLHLDEVTSDKLMQTVAKTNNFSVSEEDTILLGKCQVCRGAI